LGDKVHNEIILGKTANFDENILNPVIFLQIWWIFCESSVFCR